MKTVSSLLLLALLVLHAPVLGAPAKKSTVKNKPAAVAPQPQVPAVKTLSAEITINPREFGPDSTIELRFPTPLIAEDKVGTIAEQSPLLTVPPLEGKFEWSSTRSGIYRLTEAPKFDSSYRFELRSGIKDLEGNNYRAEKLKDINSERFRIIEQYPKWFGRTDISREPSFLLEFNDPITPEAASLGMAFKCEETKGRIEVVVRQATGADFTKYYAEPQPTWAEQIAKTKPVVEKDAPRPSAIVVTPKEPLPVGKDWILDIATTIVNAGGTSKLAAGDAIKVGTVVPFMVRSTEAHSPFDSPRYIEVEFSRSIVAGKPTPEEQKAEREARLAALTPLVKVEPAPADLKATLEGMTLVLRGSFDLGKPYQLTVDGSIVSGDGLQLMAPVAETVTFQANPPYVSAPAFMNAQLASGSGDYELAAANVSSVEIRAKTFNGPELLQAVDKYQAYVAASNGESDKREKFSPLSLDDYAGQLIYEKTLTFNKPLDQSSVFKVNWKEILANRPTGPILIEALGTALPGAPGGKTVIAQSLIQFTDIGLFQKDNFKSSTVFAVSLLTGEPLPGVKLTVVDKDHKLLGYGETDASGAATIGGGDVGFILAEKGQDATAMPAGGEDYDTLMPLWSFDLNTTWSSPWERRHDCFLFSDRPLYKPGETAHFKGLLRLASGDDLRLPGKPKQATMTIRDPDYRIVGEQSITFDANGSWTANQVLPATGATGWYTLDVSFPEDHKDTDDESSHGTLTFRVDEYRPNTFEVKINSSKADINAERIKLPLTASYLMGKPLSKALVKWNASREIGFTPPKEWQAFHFGDAPRWAHYGQDRDPDSGDAEENEPYWDAAGDVSINDDGQATIELPSPPPHSAGLPQKIQLEAEVTDINEQTIVASASLHVPGAPYLIGLKGPDYFANASQATQLEAVALTSDGKAWTTEVPVSIKVERQSYNAVRLETAGGGTTIKHQVILTPELEQQGVLKAPGDGKAATFAFSFTPKTSGTYFVTVQAQGQAAGTPVVLSRLHFYSVGGPDFPWSMNDGARIDLQPERTSFKAGEEAVILVKSPLAGEAIVTVERNRVHQHFRAKISPENPVIKVPIKDDDAPNIFVSVTLIRGAKDSTQAVKMPEYRYGYCELMVDSPANKLAVDLKPDRSPVRPAEQVTATAIITDSAGKPVPGADVTLWAVDEGVLSLMEFKTPDPLTFFHSPDPLAIRSFSSFGTLLTEDASKRYRGNKGFVIGDASKGDEGLPEGTMRKNFVATALWSTSLTTDATGKVSTTFTAPDNLSRFRIMAVTAEGAVRFGSGESSVVINKPLMVEPAMPRFARLDDEFLVKGIVHNTTPHGGTVQVTLTLDDHGEFITDHRPFILTALATASDKPAGKTWTRSVSLKPNETSSVAFPVRMTKLGALAWNWQAATAQWSDATALSDKVESKLQVEHPVPENREVRYVRVNAANAAENLVKDLDPVLLEGDGTVTLTASTSQLYDVRDALDYVLTYPYGCVEQTSSATLPWLALGGFDELFPDHLKPEKTKATVQSGVNRLLQMVTDRGGLGYWAGAEEPSLWGSAYGGFILLKARDAGADVPKKVVDELLDYLSKELRHLDDEKSSYILTDSCMAVYTLAKGGKAEPAYHTLLYNHRDRLPTRGKLFLALAMLVNNEAESQVRVLLGLPAQAEPAVAGKTGAKKSTPAPTRSSGGSSSGFEDWFGDRINTPLRLIAYTHLGLREEAREAVDKILASRGKNGDWGNTFTNAWTLQAMAAYERSITAKPGPIAVDLAWGEQKLKLDLPKSTSIAKGGFVLTKELAAQALTASVPADRDAILRLEAKSHSKLRVFAGANNGYGLTRSYHKLNPDGTTGPIDDLRVGDQVLVRLDIDTPGGGRYLAINDPLPAVLEAINPEFKTQNEDASPVADAEPWFCDHRELRTDRALFFTDFSPGKGKFTLAYQARVIAEGEVIAPSARIEAMYQPDKNGISATTKIRTLPSAGGKPVAEGK